VGILPWAISPGVFLRVWATKGYASALLGSLGNMVEGISQGGGLGSRQGLNAGREDEFNFSVSVDQ
jgi:hypothetical protein